MNRLLHVGLASLLIAAPAPAQTANALELVPEDALGFVLVKDPSQAAPERLTGRPPSQLDDWPLVGPQ
jgi:hypothetical protein